MPTLDQILAVVLPVISLGLAYLLNRYGKIKKALALLNSVVDSVADGNITQEELKDIQAKYKELIGKTN